MVLKNFAFQNSCVCSVVSETDCGFGELNSQVSWGYICLAVLQTTVSIIA